MLGIVVGVDQVVRAARDVRVRGERRLEHPGGSQVDSGVTAGMRRAEQRQPVQRGRVHVVGDTPRGSAASPRGREIARGLVAGAVQRLDRAKVRALAFGPPFATRQRRMIRAARGYAALRRGPAPSTPDGSGSSPRPSRPSRTLDRSAAPRETPAPPRRTRSYEAGRGRRGTTAARLERRNWRTPRRRPAMTGRAGGRPRTRRF